MIQGSMDSMVSGEFNVVLGVDLARSLGVGVGDRLVMITPQGQVTPAGVMPRLRQFRVSGIFEVRNYFFGFDINKYASIHSNNCNVSKYSNSNDSC